MAVGSMGVVGASSGNSQFQPAGARTSASNPSSAASASETPIISAATAATPTITGQGAQFVYAAVTVANILCDNLTRAQINLLANFLSVVTTSTYAIFTVEAPEIGEVIDQHLESSSETAQLVEPASEAEEGILR